MFLTNLRSINNKFDDLCCQIFTTNPDIVICTETWLNSNTPIRAVNIQGYDCFRSDRINDSGRGGVAIWSKSFLKAENLEFQCFDNIEICCVKVPACRVLVIGVYIPPGLSQSNFQAFCNYFCNKLDSTLNRSFRCRLLVAGDFNRYDCTFLTHNFSLSNIVSEPTRLNAVLDLVFVDPLIKQRYAIHNVKIGPPIGSSDHNTVLVIPSNSNVTDSSRKHEIYDLRESHVLEFEKEFLCHQLLSPFYEENDIDVKCNMFIKIISDSMRVIPKHVVYLSDSDSPWFTPFLKHLINKRWEAFRSRDWVMYNYLKAKVRCEIFRAKQHYFQKKSKSAKGMWSFVNIERGSRSNNNLNSLIKDNNTESGLNQLNSFFCSVMNPLTEDSFNLDTIDDGWMPSLTVIDVWRILSHLQSKATGSDDIPTRLYKKSALVLAEPIYHLIVTALQQRRFPTPWKIADVVPVPKSSNGSSLDCRPISLLPVPSKIAEEIILRDLRSRLSACLGNEQFGVRKSSSTTHAIISAYDHLTKHFDDLNVGASLLISFDFSKAFDKVDFAILLSRLKDLDIPSGFVIFLKNYLQNRQQRVRICNMKSELKTITSGVPQGSLLGPYLFGIFIASLRPQYPSSCMIKYVDDVCIIAGVRKSAFNCDIEKISQEINNIRVWSSSNNMVLNAEKTTGLINYRGSFKMTCDIENALGSVKFQQTVRLLGVMISSNLTWTSHVDSVVKKCSQRMYILRRIKNFTSIREFISVYNALIRSLIEYACPAFVCLPVGDQRRLQKIQNRCARIKDQIDLPNLSDRRKSLAMKLFNKIPFCDTFINSLRPDSLPSGRISVPYCRTSIRRNSFFPFISILSSESICD